MFEVPALSELPTTQRARGQYALRYEDIAQDGHVKLTALPPAIGVACFRPLWLSHPINRELAARIGPEQVLPILTGITIESLEGPIPVGELLDAEGGYALAHGVDGAGAVDRLFLNMSVEVRGPRGFTHGKQPAGAGEKIPVGRAFAEHVFTRPFAPREARKVLRFDVEGQPSVPADQYRWKNAMELLTLPEHAEALGPLSPEAMPTVFGLVHTDSNQHVNSLAYPALFEQAVVRRASELGVSTTGLARVVEVAYRKPCFAGDVMSLHVQLCRVGGVFHATGFFAPAGLGPERAHCTLRLQLRPS